MRDVAVVVLRAGRRAEKDRERNEVEFIIPVVQEAVRQTRHGSPRHRLHDLRVVRLPEGGPFTFVQGLDARRRLAAGRARATSRWTARGRSTRRGSRSRPARSTARLSTASGSRRSATSHQVFTLQIDPYTVAPLWPSLVELAALQARALLDAGKASEQDLAEVAARSRARRASATRTRICKEDVDADALLARAGHATRRCATPTCLPVTDGARRDRDRGRRRGARATASGRRGSGASTTASTAPHIGVRDLTERRRRGAPARRPASLQGGFDIAELHAPFSHRGAHPARGARARRRHDASTRRAARSAPTRSWPRASSASARSRARITAGEAGRGRRARDARGRACSRTSSASWRGSDGERPCRRRRGRSDQSRLGPARRVASPGSSARPRSGARGRGHRLRRHRRRRHRQGARHVRGRDDARAVPRRRARRGRQADAPRAHRRLGRRLDRDRRGASS